MLIRLSNTSISPFWYNKKQKKKIFFLICSIEGSLSKV